jgi:hypothetical protein
MSCPASWCVVGVAHQDHRTYEPNADFPASRPLDRPEWTFLQIELGEDLRFGRPRMPSMNWRRLCDGSGRFRLIGATKRNQSSTPSLRTLRRLASVCQWIQ